MCAASLVGTPRHRRELSWSGASKILQPKGGIRRAVVPASGSIAHAPRARRRWPTGRARSTSARASPSPAAEHSTPRFKASPMEAARCRGCACTCLPLSLDPRCLLRLGLLLGFGLQCRFLLRRRMLFGRPPRCCPLRCLLRSPLRSGTINRPQLLYRPLEIFTKLEMLTIPGNELQVLPEGVFSMLLLK